MASEVTRPSVRMHLPLSSQIIFPDRSFYSQFSHSPQEREMIKKILNEYQNLDKFSAQPREEHLYHSMPNSTSHAGGMQLSPAFLLLRNEVGSHLSRKQIMSVKKGDKNMSGRRRWGKLYCCPSALFQVACLKGKGETPTQYSFPPSLSGGCPGCKARRLGCPWLSSSG